MFRLRVVTALKFVLILTFTLGWLTSTSAGSTVKEDGVVCQPQHVHLSLGEEEGQMAVVWATNASCDTRVLYGTSQWLTDQDHAGQQQSSGLGNVVATGREETYTDHNARGLRVLHKAVMKGLEGSQTYFYRPTSHKIGAGPFYFKAPPRGQNWSPDLLVVGDLGPHLELLPVLTEETLKGQFNAVLQLGGLTPYLKDPNGTRGDVLMHGLEHMAAFVPVMTAPGQGETTTGGMPAYQHMFSMPGSSWPMRGDKLWYSFNLGPVHFVSLCTDAYLRGNKTQEDLQYRWLVKDLSQANTERDTRPWIVAFGHHPLYCSHDPSGNHTDGDCAKADSLVRKGLEETLYYYGVDLILLSHPRAGYERFYPLFKGVVLATNYTNPRAPVQILTGPASPTTPTTTPTPTTTTTTTVKAVNPAATTPGPVVITSGKSGTNSSSEKTHTSGGETKDRPRRAAAVKAQSLTAFKFVDGTRLTYGRLHIINATHAHWELLVGDEKDEGKVVDSFTLIQESHGKFQLSQLPDDVGKKIDHNLVANGGQPGVLNVHDPVLDTKKMLAADDSRRIIIGASFGGVVLLLIIIAIVVKVRGRSKRRTVRRWDVMDYKYGKTKLYAPTNDEEDEDDDFRDHDFEMDIPDGSMQTKKLINGK
ncbi:hypothetical protein ACOMHN_002288 [Nucella lapillus]